MQTPETSEVDTDTVACDGDGPLGHPRVFLPVGAEGVVECPYCGRRYARRAGRAPATAH